MIPIVLRIVLLFRPLYQALGVDYLQLRAIVATKLLMDNRRNTSAFQQQKKESSSRFILVVLLYMLFGTFVAFGIAFLPSLVVSMTLYHSFLMVMIIMTLISDFSSVLLDTSDNTIILPRPVSGKTLAAARITHIMLYIGQISFGLAIAPLVATFIVYGVAMTFFLMITTVLSIIFAVMFTNGFYLLLMQWTSEEKLKSIINYFQIGMTIMIMGGYQLVPRLLGPSLAEAVDFKLSWWSALVPPLWMAGALDLLYSRSFDVFHILSVFLAVVVPLVGFYAANKYLAPHFANKLADLGTNSAGAPSENRERSDSGFEISSWITKTGLERAAYLLVAAILKRDRKLKMKIYPSIASLLILVFVILLQGKGSLRIMFNSLPKTSAHIFLLYAAFFVVQTVLAEISFTDEFRAAWIYTSAPITRPGEILAGAWKAVMVRFFLPIYFLTIAFILFVWREKALDDLFFAVGSNLFLFLAVANLTNKRFPFSMEPSMRNQSGTFVRTIIMFMLLAAVGGLHFVLSKVPFALWIGGPLLMMGAYFLMKGFKATPWKDMEF